MKFLWFCAGANAQVLSRKDCYLDRDRYAAMGVLVLITAFTAALAGGYAFYTVFESIDLALLFGLFWGVTIGSMDRYFIMSTRKTSNFSFRETGVAALRLIMACLIAFTMAKPLELAVFNSEIQAKIERQQEQAITSIKQQAAPNLTQQINQLEQKNEQLREKLENQKAERDRALQAAINEADGTGGTGVQGRGPIYEEKWRRYQQEKNEYQQLKQDIETKIAQNQKQLDNLREKKQERVQQIVDAEQNADSLLTQLQALHDLAQKDPLVKWASVCLTLVLVSIDVFPILAKLSSSRGQYDYIVESEELATTKRQQQQMNDLEEQIQEESNFQRQIRQQRQEFTKDAYYTLHSEAINHPEWEAAKEEIIQSIIDNTKTDVLNLVKNYRFINRAQLIKAVEKILPKVLEEIAYSYGKEVVTKEVIDQIKKKTIKDLEMYLNNMMN